MRITESNSRFSLKSGLLLRKVKKESFLLDAQGDRILKFSQGMSSFICALYAQMRESEKPMTLNELKEKMGTRVTRTQLNEAIQLMDEFGLLKYAGRTPAKYSKAPARKWGFKKKFQTAVKGLGQVAFLGGVALLATSFASKKANAGVQCVTCGDHCGIYTLRGDVCECVTYVSTVGWVVTRTTPCT